MTTKATATAATTAQTGYEAGIIAQAGKRVGNCPQIKGTIHELLVRDSINANPLRIANGESARLVSSTSAKTVDLVVMKGGRVAERIQLKDSARSVGKLIDQINSGQYRSARVKVTPETMERLGRYADKLKGAKSVESSGVSSGYTEQLARRSGAPSHPGATTVTRGLGRACSNAAKSGARLGGIAGAGVAGVIGLVDLAQGHKDLPEVAVDVAKGGTVGALAGAAGSAAATAAGAVATGALTTTLVAVGAPAVVTTVAVVGAPIVVAAGIGYAVSSLASSAWDSLFG